MPQLRLFEVRLIGSRQIDGAMLRRRAPVLVLILAGMLLVHLALWFWAAQAARHRVESYLAKHPDIVAVKHVATGGYPFHVEVRLGDVSGRGLTGLHAAATAPQITVRLGFVWLGGVTVAAPRGISVDAGRLRIGADYARLYVTEASDAITGGSLRLQDVTMANGSARTTVDSLTLGANLSSPPPTTDTGESARFSLDLSQLHLPGEYGDLGPAIEKIQLAGEVNGRIPPGQGIAALAAWRDKGGSIELSQTRLDWGHLTVSGTGTLTLDKQLQPEAAFSATLDGWPDLVNGLASDGLMTADQARIVIFGLTLIGTPSGNGSLRVPVTIQDGALYLEKAKLFRVPKIDWPAA